VLERAGERRRLDLPSPTLSLTAPTGSNLEDVAAGDVLISAVAGVTYASLTLTASHSLSTGINVRGKLVRYNTLESECVTASSLTSSPLDGTARPDSQSGTMQRWDSVTFATAGRFRLCYRQYATWTLVPIIIEVSGGVTDIVSGASNTLRICMASNSLDCQVHVPGIGLSEDFVLGLVESTGSSACGSSSILTTGYEMLPPNYSSSASSDTLQVYNLGTKDDTTADTYLLCLCPAFSVNNATNGTCVQDEDFAQTIGKLAVTTVATSSTLYPGLTFSLTIESSALTAGGGLSSVGSARYKLIEAADATRADQWSTWTACTRSQQADQHDGPRNCGAPTTCAHVPRSEDSLSTTWEDITLGANPSTGQISAVDYDVCYCDGNCLEFGSWAMVGSITVNAFDVEGPTDVGVSADITINATGGDFTKSGVVEVREIKLLADEYGTVSRAECFEVVQSEFLVENHTCTSSTDCEIGTSTSELQVLSDITIKVPGQVAVCYCDHSCGDPDFWNVAGHFKVNGADAEQTPVIFASVPSEVVITGTGLSTGNVLTIIDDDANCTNFTAQDFVMNFTSATQASGSSGSLTALEADARGVLKLTFAEAHNISAAALITLSGVVCDNCTTDELQALNTEHRVVARLSSTELSLRTVFIGSASDAPSMDVSTATWLRTDAQSYQGVELQSDDYRLCWAASDTIDASGYLDIGVLSVMLPVQMPASVHLMSVEPAAVAPISVRFTTSHSERYEDAIGPTRLRIVFSEPSLVSPRFVDGTSIAADTSADQYSEASQTVCGKWILEVNTDSELGFPLPHGCYFSQHAESSGWELYMVFSSRNGLAPGHAYEILFNAEVAAGLLEGTAVVEVWVLDDIDRRPDAVIGQARAAVDRNVTDARVSGDPAFHSTDGFQVLTSSSDSLLQLSQYNEDVDIELRAASGNPIDAGTIVRVFLRPVFQWAVGQECNVSCTPGSGTCDTPSCEPEAFTPGIGNNTLKIGLPTGMTSITNTVRHTITLMSLPLPPGGFFPQRWAAELQASEGEKAHFTEASGALPFVQPSGGVASIVTTDGNGMPFESDTGNLLYVKLALSTTIYAATAGDAKLTITLPSSYSCTAATLAPSSLGVLPDIAPTGKGDLRQTSSWTASSNTCEYDLSADEIIFRDSSVYVAFTVDNPSTPLLAEDSTNVWSLQLTAKGDHTSTRQSNDTEFETVNADLVSSVSVLGTLSRTLIQPTVFARGHQSVLSIFFAIQQSVPSGGSVVVTAPLRFDFGRVCEVGHLPDRYYHDYDIGGGLDTTVTLPLPFGGEDAVACQGLRQRGEVDGFSRARISIGGIGLEGPDGFYGFQLYVRNAYSSRTLQKSSWYIQTQSPDGGILDGTEEPVKYLASGSGSTAGWSTVDMDIPTANFGVALASTLPDTQTEITVFPIVLSATTSGNIRVIAPPGYVWSFTSSQFIYRRWVKGRAEGTFVPGVVEDMPLAAAPTAPSSAPFNELDVGASTQPYQARTAYGFIAQITLPTTTPVDAPNVFIVEVGVGETSATSQAGITDAPALRRIESAVVVASPNVAGADSTVRLSFRTVSQIPSGGGLVIAGRSGLVENTAAEATCVLRSHTEIGLQDSHYNCSFVTSATTALVGLSSTTTPYFRVEITTGLALIAGHYTVELEVTLPTSSTTVRNWAVESYTSMDPLQVLDYAVEARGFLIRSTMTSASLLSGSLCFQEDTSTCALIDQQYISSGRDDRPGALNSLIFAFTLQTSVTSGLFNVRAPDGYEWQEDCEVITDEASVFNVSSSSLPSEYVAWPVASAPGSCQGSGDVASFSVPSPGLIAGQNYVFRISGVVNPDEQNEQNTWSLEFGTQSSEPIEGFDLFIFSNMSVAARDPGAGAVNLVDLAFAPHRTLTYGGQLEFSAPRGFTISSTCGGLAISRADGELTQVFVAADFTCEGVQDPTTFQDTDTAILTLVQKELLANVTYIFSFIVTNVAVATDVAPSWRVTSYQLVPWLSDLFDTFQVLDQGTVPGFKVLPRIQTFRLEREPSSTGLEDVTWQIGINFDEELFATDRLVLEAPAGFTLESSTTAGECRNTYVVAGPLSESAEDCDSPCYLSSSCNDGFLTWTLSPCPSYVGPAPSVDGLCVESAEFIVIAVETTNPNELSTGKFMRLEHLDTTGEVVSVAALDAYDVVPLLSNVSLVLVPGGDEGEIAQAISHLSVVNISFIALEQSAVVEIMAAVGDATFTFSSCTPQDGFDETILEVNERTEDYIVFTKGGMTPGTLVSILLTNIRNPVDFGNAFFNISTYLEYNIVVGPRFKVNEILNVPAFPIVTFLGVRPQPTSFLSTYYWSSTGVTATLAFGSSVSEIRRGMQMRITAPDLYVFEESSFHIDGQMHPAEVEVSGLLVGSEEMMGTYLINETYLRDSVTTEVPMYQQLNGSNYLYWLAEAMVWAISPNLSLNVTGEPGQAYLPITFPATASSDYVPSVCAANALWKVGSGIGWLDATDSITKGKGSLTANNSIEFSGLADLDVEEDVAFIGTMTLRENPTILSVDINAQVARNWLFEMFDFDGEVNLATNDYKFTGFQLLYPVEGERSGSSDADEISLQAGVRAPGATTSLKLIFSQVNAITATAARFRLVAPSGFTFPSSCLAIPQSLQCNNGEEIPEAVTNANPASFFADCVGSANRANLETRVPGQIVRNCIPVDIQVNMATETPTDNTWQLQLLLDNSEVVMGSGSISGFEIQPMSSFLRSSNQQNEFAVGFFTFTPQSQVEATWVIRVYAPPQAGYRVTCFGVEQVNLPAMPECTEVLGFDNELVELRVGEILTAGTAYTVGVPITNAEKTIPARVNLWRIDIVDITGAISDSTRDIEGAELLSAPLRVPDRLVQGSSSTSFIIPFEVTAPNVLVSSVIIQSATRAEIESVEVPEGLLLANATVTIQRAAQEVSIPASTGLAVGIYNVVFETPNWTPQQGVDETWTIQAYDPVQKLLFQHIMLPPAAE